MSAHSPDCRVEWGSWPIPPKPGEVIQALRVDQPGAGRAGGAPAQDGVDAAGEARALNGDLPEAFDEVGIMTSLPSGPAGPKRGRWLQGSGVVLETALVAERCLGAAHLRDGKPAALVEATGDSGRVGATGARAQRPDRCGLRPRRGDAGQPRCPVFGWLDIPPAIGVVRATIGAARTNIALAALWLGLILLVGAITAATIHITTAAARHRRDAVRGLAALTAVWALCAGLSLQLVPGSPVASTSAARLAVAQVRSTQAALRDQRRFEQALHRSDPEASVPASDLLTGLRGKDVMIDFVESYGQVAVQGTSFSRGVDAVLRRSTASLARAGWSTRSAWITSPGFGGISQLAHSTLQSGLWVNTELRYADLVASHRFTLSDAFDKAGWRTVSDSPEDDPVWPPGTQFYHFDKLYNRFNVGYHGPAFSYASMPDQYTYAKFQRNELGPGHKPVMAEIDTVSSHTPWAPLPTMVPWNKVGNGSIFDSMPARSESPIAVWRNASTVRQFFGRSLQYSLETLTSWVTELHDPNLVLILLGDEQPGSPITGPGASHEVPISIVAHDPSVFRQIASWHWQNGLLPGRSAPLELMDTFRNQFLDAFSTPSSPTASAP